ncbi:MAG: cytochrome C biogenesis protein [Piscirickettsiaceae bacterium]|nr:MAG: cytochrome C biogenesis protein [Piscirickettsiaceae bacterium]
MEYKDYYKIMGVDRDATQDQIKRAYRKLARKYHPDINKESDAEVRFKEVGEAYAVLKDPEKRVAYDQLGSNWQSGQDFKPPPNWDQGFEFRGGDAEQFDAEQFGDFFESLYGKASARDFDGQTHREFHMRGEDTHAKVVIDLEDAYKGATRTITLKQTVLDADGRPHLKERKLKIQIPKGIRQGQHIRLAKQGGVGMGRGEAGDLYLQIEFQAHALYHIEGGDVYLDLPVAPWEAALGSKVKVPTPTGVVEMVVPENSTAGRKLRLKGRGIPGKQPGDFYVVIQIALPPADSESAKAAYQNMEKELAFNPRAHLEV